MPKNETEEINQKISAIKENRGVNDNVLDTKISLSVKGILSVVLAVVVISGAFLAGRYVFPSGTSLADFASAAAVVGVSKDDSVSTTTELEDSSKEDTSTDTPVAEPETTEETADETTEETTDEAAETDTADEVVITKDYANVVLEFTRTPAFEWKGTWGKITTIYYTLTNNEAGTIKPATFRLTAEGYDTADFIKTADVPKIDGVLSAGEVAKHGVDIKLQYSESITNPTNLRLTFQLFDKDGNLIDAVTEEFNLKE